MFSLVIIFIVLILTTIIIGYFFFFQTRIDTTEKQVTDTSTHIDERVQSLADFSVSKFAPLESVSDLRNSIQQVSKTLHQNTIALSNLIMETNHNTQNYLTHNIAYVDAYSRDFSTGTAESIENLNGSMSNMTSDLHAKYSTVQQDVDEKNKMVENTLKTYENQAKHQYNDLIANYQIENKKFTNKINTINATQDNVKKQINKIDGSVVSLYNAHNGLAQYATNANTTLKQQIDSYYTNLNELRNYTYNTSSNLRSNIDSLDTKFNFAVKDFGNRLTNTFDTLNSNIADVSSNTSKTLAITSSNLSSLVSSNFNNLSTSMSNYQNNATKYMASSLSQLANVYQEQKNNLKSYTDKEVAKSTTNWMNYMTAMSNVKSISGDIASFKQVSMPGTKASCRVIDPGWKVMGSQSNKWTNYLSMCKDNEYMNGINVMWNGNADGKNGQGARVIARCCKIPGLLDESVPAYYGTTYTEPNKFLGVQP